MKFKVNKGTKLFNELIAVLKKMDQCHHAAWEIVEEVGATSYRGSYWRIGGGITALGFKKQPEGYRKEEGYNSYFPKKIKVNKELLAKIDALPTVTFEDINTPLKFDFPQHIGNKMVNVPEVLFRKDHVLINVKDECTYTPVEGMIEILGSEWIALGKTPHYTVN